MDVSLVGSGARSTPVARETGACHSFGLACGFGLALAAGTGACFKELARESDEQIHLPEPSISGRCLAHRHFLEPQSVQWAQWVDQSTQSSDPTGQEIRSHG